MHRMEKRAGLKTGSFQFCGQAYHYVVAAAWPLNLAISGSAMLFGIGS